MLEHLLDFEPEPGVAPDDLTPVEKASPTAMVDAQIQTEAWLSSLGAVDVDQLTTNAEINSARQAFNSLVTAAPDEHTRAQLAEIKTPAAVRHLTGMLSAYDWEFVNQAKELRGYVVAKLLEECEHPTATVRLKALGLLGKVTEVGLFTEKIEVKQAPATDAELDARIKEKLGKFMGVIDVVDVSKKDDEIDVTDVTSPKTSEESTDLGENPDDTDQAGA